MAHRDRNLTIAALETLDARERRAPEVLFKRRRYRIGLLRRPKAKVKLLLVVDKVTCTFPCCIGYMDGVHLQLCIIAHCDGHKRTYQPQKAFVFAKEFLV